MRLTRDLSLSVCLVLVPFWSGAWAGPVGNRSELALLPPYCKGTLQIRNLSGDTTSIEQYVAMYGESYRYLHYYCWGLNAEAKSIKVREKLLRHDMLQFALFDIKRAIDYSEPDFVFLPNMHLSQARILFVLDQKANALSVLNKLIEMKSDYAPAYAELSDYYADNGDKPRAIKILRQGIDHTEDAEILLKRLKQLGKPYEGVPGSARKPMPLTTSAAQEEVQLGDGLTPVLPPATDAAPTRIESSGDVTDQATRVNPFCRFCP